MTEIDHISVPWLERKVLDALDQIEGRLDHIDDGLGDVDDRLGDVELKLEAVFKAFDQNNAIHQETRDEINVLIDQIETLRAATCVLVKALGMDPPEWSSGEGRKPS